MRQHSTFTSLFQAPDETSYTDSSAGLFAPITPQTLGLHPPGLYQPQFAAPTVQVATAASPTVTQFLDAANAEYIIGGVPAGLHALTFLGIPVSYTNELDGLSAQAWVTPQNQVVIAYQGTTGGLNLLINPVIVLPQIIADLGIYAGTITPEEKDALNFANTVVTLAHLEGYSNANIFVTGHSLGGIDAEYVASQTGLGGIGFESTGLPVEHNAGNGANFVNTVTYGDPVGNYASDVSGEQTFAPAYVAGGGTLPHYGQIVTIGNATDQATLTADTAKWDDGNPLDQIGVLANLAGLMVDFHLPGVQAHDLGVSLNPYSSIVDGIGIQTAPVYNVSNDTISQLIASAASTGHLLQG